jgi:hypothetical protein
LGGEHNGGEYRGLGDLVPRSSAAFLGSSPVAALPGPAGPAGCRHGESTSAPFCHEGQAHHEVGPCPDCLVTAGPATGLDGYELGLGRLPAKLGPAGGQRACVRRLCVGGDRAIGTGTTRSQCHARPPSASLPSTTTRGFAWPALLSTGCHLSAGRPTPVSSSSVKLWTSSGNSIFRTSWSKLVSRRFGFFLVCERA